MALIAALAWLVSAGSYGAHQITFGFSNAIVGGLLVAALIIAYRFPIHIRHHAKVVMTSVPRYILAILLPPPVAVLAAVLGTASGELITRKERGMYLSDIATELGRTTFCVLAASMTSHWLNMRGVPTPVGLGLAAIVLFATDIVTSPILLCPMNGERPLRVMAAVLHGSGPAEGAQYLLGVIGAILAHNQPFAIALLAIPTVLVYVAYKNVEEVHSGTRRILETMADTVDLRDPYTGGHSKRVASYSQDIMRQLAMHGPEAELIVAVARVHDIGKIAIPDAVLNKPGRLTDEEFAVMATHAELGADLLLTYPDFAKGASMVRYHHEQWDGSGHFKQMGADIPLGARVIAVADSYDAMTSDRPYRTAMSSCQAVTILRTGRGRQWDANIVDAFLGALEEHGVIPATVRAPQVARSRVAVHAVESMVAA
jgi:hypothetical protein